MNQPKDPKINNYEINPDKNLEFIFKPLDYNIDLSFTDEQNKILSGNETFFSSNTLLRNQSEHERYLPPSSRYKINNTDINLTDVNDKKNSAMNE